MVDAAGERGGRARKVGVLTFHRCYNYGSYWQARCLVEGLRAFGHDAELLDHDSPRVAMLEARCLLHPTLPARSTRAEVSAYKAKGRRFAAAFAQLPLSPRFPLEAPREMADRYDAVVIGSDEVWNFRHPWYSGASIFFGEGLPAERTISYAASFGNYDAADGLSDDWARRIAGFHAVSVRDANSRALVEGAVGVEPALVLDPCLQFPEGIDARGVAQGGRYAIVYGHGFPDWLAAALRRWADATGTRLVSVGYANPWADDQRLDAGPHDFAALMAGAAAVVTNFFHGCVFALVNGVPFVSAPSPYRFNKVRDLSTKLGFEERIVGPGTPAATWDAFLARPPGPDVERRIAALRAQSADYLRVALA